MQSVEKSNDLILFVGFMINLVNKFNSLPRSRKKGTRFFLNSFLIIPKMNFGHSMASKPIFQGVYYNN